MKKIFTFVIAALSAVTMSAKGDIITFGEADVADKGTWSDGKVFTGEDNLISIKLTDTDSKMAIDANNANFGVAEQYDKFTHRLKTGGKSSAKNAIELTVAEDGEVFFFVRSGNGSDLTRTLVLSQEGTVILSQIVKDEDAVTIAITDTTSTRVFPIYSASVKAGTYAVEYPVNGLNFYAFGFSNGSSEGEGEEVGEVVSLVASDFAAVDPAGKIDQTVKDIHVEISNGLINAEQIRIYKSSTLTISAEKEISAIVFTCTANGDAKYGPGCFAAQDGYTYSNDQGTWTGNAKSVSFKAESNQVRATKIEVYFGGKPAEKEILEVSVAQAIEAGSALDSAATSEDIYAVTGYVVNAAEFNLQYGNQIWFMSDVPANANEAELFEAYACTVEENGETLQVIDGDLVKLTGKITKYFDKENNKFIIEIKNGTAEFIEKAEGDHSLPVLKVDTVTVAEAIAAAEVLTPEEKASATTAETYAVKGYIAKIKDEYNAQYGNMTFFMTDDPFSTYGDLQAYRCKIAAEDAEKAVVGAYVIVTGQIQKYNGGTYVSYEIAQGTVEIAEAPEIEIKEVSVAEALEIGKALEDNTVSAETYAVHGFVTKAYEFDEENLNQNFYMADDATAFGEFYAYRAKPATPVADGDEVILTGKIKKYVNADGTKTTIEIEYGQVEIIRGEGIENVELTEKVQKVVVDGVIYIVRDNKMYNIQGAQVR